MRLSKRAEANDPAKLVETFVDVGTLFTQLSSRDHQIIYGRRGTGKTHAFQYLAAKVRQDNADIAVYVDMRTIGSTGGIYADPTLTISERGTRLLSDTLAVIHSQLTDAILEATYESEAVLPTNDDFTSALKILDDLATAIQDVRVVGEHETETTTGETQSADRGSSLSATVGKSPSVGASLSEHQQSSRQTGQRTHDKGVLQSHVHFGAVSSTLTRLSAKLPGKQIWILLDEWAVVPLELQPILGDMVRRCLFPIRHLTVKIGAIEQRSNFRVDLPAGGYLGIELGADAAVDVNLDDFLVFGTDESSQEKAKSFFAELLFRHVRAFYAGEGSADEAPPSAADMIRHGFTQMNAFAELVRAAEGVPRDAINIVALAAQHAESVPLSMPHVRQAAGNWYMRDKEKAIEADPQAHAPLTWIIDEVIGRRKARAFLLQAEESGHPLIGKLYDARVLHLLKSSVSTHDRPGVRFRVYGLDFGCYVQLINTAKEPESLLPGIAIEDIEVPRDDYRAIRTAILRINDFLRARGLGGEPEPDEGGSSE